MITFWPVVCVWLRRRIADPGPHHIWYRSDLEDNALFYALAALLLLAVGACLVRPLMGRRRAALTRSAHDMAVYRDQLAEVERDLARNVIAPEEAEAIRTEVSRRLLGAADAEALETEAAPAAPAASRNMAVGLLAFTLLAGGGLYASLGQPGLRDQPLQARIEAFERQRAERPGQAEIEARVAAEQGEPDLSAMDPEHIALLERLREILADRPDDLRGHRLLATNLTRLGLWAEAQKAQGNILRILGDAATGSDYIDRAEFMILATAGYVSPEAERVLAQGVERTPGDPRGRYYSGLLLAQAGRPDIAYRLWAQLLDEGPPDAPWVQAILPEIGRLAEMAGIRPNAMPGPDADAVAAAGDMAPEDREAMIRGMVDGLSDRLATEGGPPAEWARLIRSLGVLGETGRASAIWNEARDTFADDPRGLAEIREAARAAEVIQ